MIQKRPVAIVTGGTGAVGQCVAHKLYGRGFHVIIPYRDETKWEKLQKTLPGLEKRPMQGIRLDLKDESAVSEAVTAIWSRYHRIDALVNCAGSFRPPTPFAESTANEWREMWEDNTLTAVNVSKAVFDCMKEQKRGSILFIAAEAALHAPEGLSHYSTSKRNLLELADTLVKEGAPHGLRVNTLLPGMIATEANLSHTTQPHPDLLTPEQIGEVVGFLLTAAGQVLNGSWLRFTRPD